MLPQQENPGARPAYMVRIMNQAGLYAKVGLKSGDYIIGVNGEDFVDMKQMVLLMAPVMKQKSSSLTVLRGSSRMIVELDLSATGFSNDAAGGRMYPTTR